jgi:O-antigen ligase
VSSLALRAQVDAQRQTRWPQQLLRSARQALGAFFSFESFYILYVFSGLYKSDPRLAWVPGDLTAILFFLTLFWGLLILMRGGFQLRPRALNLMWFFAAFVAWVLITTLWSPSVIYAQRKALYFPTLTTWAIFAAAFIISADAKRLQRFFALLLAFSMWVTLESFLTLRQNFVTGNFRGLIRALGSHYGSLGVVIGNGVLLLLLYLIYHVKRPLWRLSIAGLIAGIMALLLFMGSRTSLVFPVVSSLVPLSLNLRWPRSPGTILKVIGAGVVALVLIAVLWNKLVGIVPGGPATLKRFSTLGRRGIESEGRFRNLEEAAQILNGATIPQLFFGHGLGSWPILLGDNDIQRYPHNIVIEIAVELGLVGLGLFAAMLIYAIRCLGPPKQIRRDPLKAFLATLLLSIFVVASVSGDLHENRGLFMMLGLCMYSSRRLKAEG